MPNYYTIDVECFYSQEYSLTRMTTEAYVRSGLFETIGIAVKVNDAPAEWFSGTHKEIKNWLDQFKLEEGFVIMQNAHFDGAVLEWLYDIHPKRYFDTLSMANALVGVSQSVSLKNLAVVFGIGEKGTAVLDAKGKHLADFTASELVSYGEYCKNDVELTYLLFKFMLAGIAGTSLKVMLPAGYPVAELKLIDTTIKMFTRPTLVLDAEVLQNHLWDVQEKKRDLINSLMKSLGAASIQGLQAQLNSNPQFAQLLRERGVEPPMKLSPATGKETYAFAKTDEAFQLLADHDDPEIQALYNARVGTKSTIEETRTEKFLDVASRGTFPIPLKYSGASVSQRWSGCLVGATEILVYDHIHGEVVKPIINVLPDDLVWDGEEFVTHGGVKFSGYREVITYGGITATPEHIVFTQCGKEVALIQAANAGYNLKVSAYPTADQVAVARTNAISSTIRQS